MIFAFSERKQQGDAVEIEARLQPYGTGNHYQRLVIFLRLFDCHQTSAEIGITAFRFLLKAF